MFKRLCFGYCGFASTWAALVYAVVRASLGVFICVGHGYGKLFHDGSFGPTPEFIGMTGKLGFPAPTLFAWLAALTEFLGGALLALGLLTRPVAFGLVFNMGVAAFVAHAAAPWLAKPGEPSKELAMLYLLPFLLFLAIGGGRFSLDALFAKPRKLKPAA